jgi:hypothetical protein
MFQCRLQTNLFHFAKQTPLPAFGFCLPSISTGQQEYTQSLSGEPIRGDFEQQNLRDQETHFSERGREMLGLFDCCAGRNGAQMQMERSGQPQRPQSEQDYPKVSRICPWSATLPREAASLIDVAVDAQSWRTSTARHHVLSMNAATSSLERDLRSDSLIVASVVTLFLPCGFLFCAGL